MGEMNITTFTAQCVTCEADYDAYALPGMDPATMRGNCPRCRDSRLVAIVDEFDAAGLDPKSGAELAALVDVMASIAAGKKH